MNGRVISLTLPYPPLTNNLYATLILKGKPVRVPSKELKQFKRDVGKICIAEKIQPFVADVAVLLKVHRPQRSGDLDGTFKAVLDSLKGSAFYDDKQVTWFHAERFEDKRNPRAEVQIWARSLL